MLKAKHESFATKKIIKYQADRDVSFDSRSHNINL